MKAVLAATVQLLAEHGASGVTVEAIAQRPLSGRSSKLITRSSVLLPAPEAPMIPNTSPGSTRRSIPWSAGTRRPSTS